MNNREIIMENYLHPFHKETKNEEEYLKANSNNASCIDNLNIYLKVKDNKIIDGYFDGEACAIATSSASIMLQELIGKPLEEVKEYIKDYKLFIDEGVDSSKLNLSKCYLDIHNQENRKTCAKLAYLGVEKIIEELEK